MPLIPLFAGPIIAALIASVALPAQASERDQLNACKTKVERAAPAQRSPAADDGASTRCRQIAGEGTLQDWRISVDELGRRLP
jgi:hypothetical protein